MAEKINLLTLSVLAAATLNAEQFVTYAGDVPASGAPVLGVAAFAATSGQEVAVQTDGVAIVTSGAAITAGAAVMSDASGNAIAWTTTNTVVGRAIDAATASGQRIRVKLIPN